MSRMQINTSDIRGRHAFNSDSRESPDFQNRNSERDFHKDDNSPERKRSRVRSRDQSAHDSDSNMSNTLEIMPPASNSDPLFMMGQMDNVMMNMFVNPSMMGMNNYMVPPMLTPNPGLMSTNEEAYSFAMNPVKEIIHFKSCTLFPPSPHAPAPTTRDRPLGCKTVFVGGLPEKITEEIIQEVFEKCGEITTLRLSKKNFCHVRFVFESSVDAAIYLSGYRIRIGSNVDTGFTGRLHVDYAQARDDQYEFECRQRQFERERRHRERMEEERLKRPSPPPITHFSDHEASSISEKLKHDDSFTKALQVVITWLERGDCNKKNANIFYSMIQSTNSHVRRLLTEKGHYEDELKKAKDLLKGRMQGILLQFSHIERLFEAAHHKKVWDHFTKAQRKNIEGWNKQSLEIKNFQLDESQDKQREDDEMDVSDDEECNRKKNREINEERNNLKDENDSLKCQVDAYKNEVEVIKLDCAKALEDKDLQMKVMQQTLQAMQQQLVEAKKKFVNERLRPVHSKMKPDKSSKITEVINLDDDESEPSDGGSVANTDINSTVSAIPSSDAKLIGIISIFLHVHPFGAGLDYITSYVNKSVSNMRPAEVESLMTKYSTLFKQDLVGIGANMERRWLVTAFGKNHQVSD
ncbi:ecto-NOX disulfide-thiol exchanger 2 [Euwallacea similis]|uniref:ecto-NOX disulfide-thiol exchanger 2 n=1 Tax=Euwallacea similis TaxID=1736056 RepID=UPI00344FD88C